MTSTSCVFGIAFTYAFLLSRVCVFCSYAYANPMSSNSLQAVPMNDSPNGAPGPGRPMLLALGMGTVSSG
jgi:hypothetical protein